MIFVLTNQQKREREREIEREREREKHLHGFLIVHILFACVFEEYLLKSCELQHAFFENLKTHAMCIKKKPHGTNKLE